MATTREIIRADKGYKAKATKYSNPLISYYGHSLPAWILRAFLKQATIEEIATFYFGYFGSNAVQFLGFIQVHGLNLPDVHTIKIPAFWDAWQRNNLLAIMDTAAEFGK